MSTGDDSRRKMLGALGEVLSAQERLGMSLHMESAAERALKQIQQRDVGIRHALDEVARNQSLARTALEDFRRLDSLNPMKAMLAEHERMRTLFDEYKKRFVLPQVSEAQRLYGQLRTSGYLTAFNQFQEEADRIRRSMDAMQTPWLDVQNKMQSLAGFTEIQSIGLSLKRLPAFDDTVTAALRHALGDWRDRITWPSAIFTDPFARSEFYVARGFNPHLTDFPEEAFEESLKIAGLGSAGPDIVEAYRGDNEPADENDEEAGLARNNAAYNQLLRFETHIRHFIETKMLAAWGDKWIKQRVPGGMRQQWAEKQQKDRDNGRHGQPLIAYADFADYEKIIVRNDNWEAIFKPIFRRQEFVTEAFQRLYPLRLSTMHARIITQDDELILRVEVMHVLKAIGVSI